MKKSSVLLYSSCETFQTCPGGGLDKPKDRDQRSSVFLNDPTKYFAPDRKPQKQNHKNTLKSTIRFTKVQHDMIIMETHDY